MKFRRTLNPCSAALAVAFTVLLVGGSPTVSAANLTWTGATNNSFFDANWSPTGTTAGTVTITSADNGNFGDVATGIRNVRVNTSGSALTYSFIQTSASGVNAVTVDSGVTLTLLRGGANVGGSTINGGAGNAAAGISAAITNINGGILLSNANASNPTFYNTVNLGSGAIIDNFTSSATTSSGTTSFAGTLNVDVGVGNLATIQKTGAGSTGGGTAGFQFNNGSTLNLTSGELDMRAGATGTSSNLVFTGAAGSSLNVSAGATLAFLDTGNNKVITLTNGGTLTQAGAISLRTTTTGANTVVNSFTNTGTWIISGTGATLAQSALSGTGAISTTVASSGILQGATTADTLTYSNAVTAATKLTINNSGTVAPGNGTGGAATVGMLTLTNTNLTFSAAGNLNIDVNGASSGQYDVLSIGGVLTLTAGNTLNVTLNNFTPTSSFNLPIINYTSATGTDATNAFTVLVNGQANSSYSLQYNSTQTSLIYTAVPEPDEFAMMAILGAMLIGKRLFSLRRLSR